MTLDVAQILAPVSSGLVAAGAPASDGTNSDGGDFAALLTALAGVLGANRLTPAAVSPNATAQVATKSASFQAETESPSPFLAVADAGGLQALGAPIPTDTGGLQLQDPEVEGERDTLAGPEQADSNLAATYPGDARLVLAMAQVLSPTPTQPSPIAPEAGAPAGSRGEATAALISPGQSAPGMAPAGSPPAPSGIATGARPDGGQAQPADKPQVKTTDAQATLLASLQAPDILPGAEVPEATGQITADPRPAGAQGSDSVADSPPEAASSLLALPPGVVRIVGRQMPAEPAPPAQGAGPGAAAAAMSADIIAPEETIPTPPMTAKVVAAATSEPSLLAQAAAVSELAALVEPPPSRRQDSVSSRSPEARRTLTATATEPGSAAPESPAPAPLVTSSVPSGMPSSTQAPGTAVGDDPAKDSGVDLKAMAAGALGREAAEATAPPPAAAELRPAPPAQAPPVRSTPETVAALAVQAARKLDDGITRFDLELDPLGLGRVDVHLEIDASGRIRAAFTFESSHSARELSRRAEDLQRSLESSGFNLSGGLSFDVAGDRSQGRSSGWNDGRDGQHQPASPPEREAHADTLPPPSSPLAGRGLSLRAGVDIRI
ncbi:flagellar hook-length control protein FliK [Phenylobacterium sp.]|uniref:flagellar hook-length control protein FliK n=1 Tax=Phenylobacterium sp. TaxID=1871053 RepID=UPI0037C75625